jgi:hypothetical protein
MSEEGDRKLYAHYKKLTEGSMKTGNPVRDDLIVSDAKKHLTDLVSKTKKHSPDFVFEEEQTKEKKVPEKKINSKEKEKE